MAARLGIHSPRLRAARELLTAKGRRKSDRFLFEGPTLLEEARRSGLEIDAIYATAAAYEGTPLLHRLESREGVSIIAERACALLSDVESPTGIVVVARRRLEPLGALLHDERLVLALADLNDPGNAGTLARSAEAFGAGGVVFGKRGVDPYHPKVVRAAMGSLFRLRLALGDAAELAAAAHTAGRRVYGLSPAAKGSIAELGDRSAILVVGQERRGLGGWEAACDRLLRIPAPGPANSLNAAVAGSIALYQASVGRCE